MKKIITTFCSSFFVLLLCFSASSAEAAYQIRNKVTSFQGEVIEALNNIDSRNMDLLDSVIDAASEVSGAGESSVTIDEGDLDENDSDDWYKFTIFSAEVSEEMTIILATDTGQSEIRICIDCLSDDLVRAFTAGSREVRSTEWIRPSRPFDLTKEITFTPEPGKTYYIDVHYIGGGPINYSLVINPTSRTTLDLNPWMRNGLLQVDPHVLADAVQSLDNTCDQANVISGSYISGLTVSEADKQDWYRFNIEPGYNPLKVVMDAIGGESSLTIYGSCEGRALDASDNRGPCEEVVVDSPPAGAYYLCVRHISGDPTSYSLTISGAPNPCADDSTPPDTTVSGCPDQSELPPGTTEYTLDLCGSDNCTDASALRFRYALIHDGTRVRGWTDTPAACHLTALSPGWWDFYACALDDASNADGTPAYCRFYISQFMRPQIRRPR